jgi:peptide chain release factor 1
MWRSIALIVLLVATCSHAFAPRLFSCRPQQLSLKMAIDEQMEARLDGIRRSYKALTERLGDPDVIGNSNLLRQVMSDRSQSEEVVLAYEEYMGLKEELEGNKELFQESDTELKEMARAEMKEIEAKMDTLESEITILLLPKDPNDSRNVMVEIRAGTGGSEANIFAGTCVF